MGPIYVILDSLKLPSSIFSLYDLTWLMIYLSFPAADLAYLSPTPPSDPSALTFLAIPLFSSLVDFSCSVGRPAYDSLCLPPNRVSEIVFPI